MMNTSARSLGQQFASGVRAFHGHARPPPGKVHAHIQTPTTGARLLQSARTFVTRIVSDLQAPGLSRPSLSSRIHTSVRPPSIEARLSLPARTALRGIPKAPFLPKASLLSRNTTQVGLGTARNFSSGRPIFEHLVQNVPVAARAICEADVDVEKRKMKARKAAAMALKKKGLKTNAKKLRSLAKVEKKTAELEHYFPTEATTVNVSPNGTTTVLLVPLAPTPTSRFPLTEASSDLDLDPRSFIQRRELRDLLSSHRKHQLRVSSLFARLDAARVWDSGASMSALGDPSGLCTLLRVDFVGWAEDAVRKVMGEAGRGWCEVFETKNESARSESMSSLETKSESEDSAFLLRSTATGAYDPSDSVVLPTLDFSASFQASRASSVRAPFCDMDPNQIPPSPPSSRPHSGCSSPMFALSSLAPSELGDVEMRFEQRAGSDESSWSDGEGLSFAEASPGWTNLELASVSSRSGFSAPSPRMMGLSAAFLERAQAGTCETAH